ncbi:hypothetical protein BDF14DRAFT_1045686 [Spinellus fusiger]|nr:hypothetical protein BDF14DRAFT_1045686 [Spinellus fusiger]
MSAAMRLIDIGINLTDSMFRGIYRGKHVHADDYMLMIERAKRAGVERLIITGTNLKDSRLAVEKTKKTPTESGPMLYSTVGCHPTRCKEFNNHAKGPEAYYAALLAIVTENKKNVVAIGECGLDYDRLMFCPKDIQKIYFEKQFDLAEKTKLPMFLHSRNTGNDFYDMVKANRHRFTGGVVHSFTGSLEEMKSLVELGLYIGVNGCSLKTQANIEVVKQIPIERLMLETDGPWCDIRPTHASYSHLKDTPAEEMKLYAPPSKKKEKFEMGYTVKSRNEPCAMGLVLYSVASIRGCDPHEFAEIVWNNTCQLFFPDEYSTQQSL